MRFLQALRPAFVRCELLARRHYHYRHRRILRYHKIPEHLRVHPHPDVYRSRDIYQREHALRDRSALGDLRGDAFSDVHDEIEIHGDLQNHDPPMTVFHENADPDHPVSLAAEGASLIFCRPLRRPKLTSRYPKPRILPFIWLRDNCRCAECVNQTTMQRSLNTFDIPRDIRPTMFTATLSTVTLKWSDGHTSVFPWGFIENSGKITNLPERIIQTWDSKIAKTLPTVDYEAVMNTEEGVAKLTDNIKRIGFVLVENTPFDDPNKTKELLERIGPIRVTHYGGFYDFTPNLAMADTAYTNEALPPHTDTTYFTEPAGLQAFHLLSHQPAPGASADEAAVSGGKTVLVDGFHAARFLQQIDKPAWTTLTKVAVPWHASGNAGITIAPDKLYPVLETRGQQGPNGVHRIRWNNADRGVVPFGWTETPQMWYKAARRWNELLSREDFQLWLQLEPGKVLIFDNWRVLHGRSAFTGIRRICGGYINRDDFISRWRNTNYKREEVIDRVLG
ncbi:9df8b3d9-3dc7-48d4-b94c-25275bb52e7b [Thermothielavioides terrestris]|uniref:trimethyllysine dioxygenase n=1 Tax=Thermothielavioides terrestris TaxID=2587410 RepID=A0A3S4EWS2_9PEZI|nr:9df8b3d9-3dc7-48d4-b94c-25275bb52e7b [Thermothielavioides terrestris]